MCILAGATVEDPKTNTAIQHRPMYNNPDFKLSCTASATRDVTFEWIKGQTHAASESFTSNSIDISGSFSFDLNKAIHNTMTWNVRSEEYYKCNTVDFYSDNYTCIAKAEAASSQTTDTSGNIEVIVQCK